MKIIRTLKISPEEFFTEVEQGVLAQIARATGQEAAPSAIRAGYRFVEGAHDPRRRSETQVIDYVPGVRYESRTIAAGDDVTMSYEVAPAQKGEGITVTYRQEMASFNARKRGFMKGFSEAVYLGRMAESLFKIQDAALDRREGVERPVAAAPQDHKVMRQVVQKLSEKRDGDA